MQSNNPQIKKSFRNPRNKDFLRRIEVVSAIIIIFLMSIFIGSNLMIGFVFPLFLSVGFIVFLISFFFPRAGFYAIIFLTFVWERFFTLAPVVVGRQEYKIYSLDILFIGILLGTGWHIFNSYIRNEKHFRVFLNKLKQHSKIIKLFVAFTVLIGLHFLGDILFQSEINKSVAFSSFKYYAFYPLFFLLAIILFDKKEDIKILFKFALAGGLAIIFFIIYGIINHGGLWTEFTPMSTGGIRILAFTHAFYLSMVWLGLFVFTIKQKNTKQKYYVWLGIFAFGILGSMMRHLWLGLGFSLIVIILFFFKKDNRKFLVERIGFYTPFFIAGLAIFSYIVISFPYSSWHTLGVEIWQAMSERFASLGQIKGDSSFSWRQLAWQEAIKQYLHHPLYGLGFGKSIYLETMNYHDFVEVRNIHNSWLVLFIQAGLFISGIFLLFLIEIAKRIFKSRDINFDWLEITTIILIINYIFIALFQPYLETNMLGIFFWILLGLAVNLFREKRKRLHKLKRSTLAIPKLTMGRIIDNRK